MAVKNLWFGILVLYITTCMIGEVQAQAGHGESSQQPGSIRRMTAESNERRSRAISRGGFESNRSSSDVFFRNSTGVSLANAGDTEEAGPGCPNVECHNGFVYQQGAYLAPGDKLDGGNHMTIKFLKDGAGNWRLYTGPGDAYVSQIGYFPESLFTDLPVQAARASFGGCVRFIDNLMSPPMGNGVFAKDNIPSGQPTPAMMTGVNFVRPDGSYYPIDSYSYRLGYLNCYGLGKFMIDNDRFVYGGPGGCYS
ncbi:hypothetical protein FCM35_KLT05483 [Carex littledalei]|uniref:Neprosin PEP catalytic domain-containing protein n=1 Tax=Carex littledalei TaxID=544730 RepID=A0A833R018_9POAL|nr:hypothetical protein FCM35_KLT05483 [Carex littledalei]